MRSEQQPVEADRPTHCGFDAAAAPLSCVERKAGVGSTQCTLTLHLNRCKDRGSFHHRTVKISLWCLQAGSSWMGLRLISLGTVVWFYLLDLSISWVKGLKEKKSCITEVKHYEDLWGIWFCPLFTLSPVAWLNCLSWTLSLAAGHFLPLMPGPPWH